MDITVSVWQPWMTARWKKISIAEQVNMIRAIGANAASIKSVNREWVFGAKENFSSVSIYQNTTNDAFEIEAKAQGLDVHHWGWVDCQNPGAQADAVKKAIARWNPKVFKIDNELEVAKKYAYNTGAFLRSLGRPVRHDGTPVQFFLQSYRRPDLHPEIAWEKWLTYRAPDGVFYLTGHAPQAYWFSNDVLGDFEKMLKAHEDLERRIGRRGLPWHITLPTFAELGWYPTPEQMETGIDFLRAELGERLVGVDFWRLEWLMTTPEGKEMREMLMSYDWGEDEPQDEDDPGAVDGDPIGIHVTVTDTKGRPVNITALLPDGGSVHVVEG